MRSIPVYLSNGLQDPRKEACGSSTGYRMFLVATLWDSPCSLAFSLRSLGNWFSILCTGRKNEEENMQMCISTLNSGPFPWTLGRQRMCFLNERSAWKLLLSLGIWTRSRHNLSSFVYWVFYLTPYLRLDRCRPVTCCFSQGRRPRVQQLKTQTGNNLSWVTEQTESE